jgi:hypothetical protein
MLPTKSYVLLGSSLVEKHKSQEDSLTMGFSIGGKQVYGERETQWRKSVEASNQASISAAGKFGTEPEKSFGIVEMLLTSWVYKTRQRVIKRSVVISPNDSTILSFGE